MGGAGHASSSSFSSFWNPPHLPNSLPSSSWFHGGLLLHNSCFGIFLGWERLWDLWNVGLGVLGRSLLRHSPRSRQVLLSLIFRGLWEQPGSPGFLWGATIAEYMDGKPGNWGIAGLWVRRGRALRGKHTLTPLPPSRGIIQASPSPPLVPGMPPACSKPEFWQQMPLSSPWQVPSCQGILLRPAPAALPKHHLPLQEHPGSSGSALGSEHPCREPSLLPCSIFPVPPRQHRSLFSMDE